jgi:hypothetical protein
MKGILSISAAWLLPCLMLGAASPGQATHYRLSSDLTVKGKGKEGQCFDYASALASRLAQAGIHGQLFFYKWHIRGTWIEGSHVFVMYHLTDGTEWIVDNEMSHPKPVPADASPIQLVFLLNDSQPGRVEVQLQQGLNRLSYF